MPDRRRDPAELLSQARSEERKAGMGRLKIFFDATNHQYLTKVM